VVLVLALIYIEDTRKRSNFKCILRRGKMETKATMTVTIDRGLLARIDSERGLAKRSTYVEHLIAKALRRG
jgi:LDH2 family malate/lactate/ureidoglycolate dehydrogenase